MVRVWHPALIEHLDDPRLLAQHAETHYILNAQARASGIWWLHPETQRLHGREPEIRHIHDVCANLMLRAGIRHASPTPGPRRAPDTSLWDIEQDLADLGRKWSTEGRITFYRGRVSCVLLGAPIAKPARWPDQLPCGTFKSGAPIFGFRSPRDTTRQIRPETLEIATRAREDAASFPQRLWTKADTALLKETASLRSPTTDLTDTELLSLLPKGWTPDQRKAHLRKVRQWRDTRDAQAEPA